MKSYVRIAIAVSMFAPAAAFAEGSAFSGLTEAAGLEAAAAVSAPAVSAVAPAVREADADILDLTASGADELAAASRVSGAAVFEMDGARMNNKKNLMEHASRTLGLPDDMDNWDAMIDYLGDLPSFARNNNILVIVRNGETMRRANPQLYNDLRDVMMFAGRNAQEWSRGAVQMKFVFVM